MTPEIGIFACGFISILIAYVIARALRERIRGRRFTNLRFWNEIGGSIIWLAGSLAALVIFIQEYRDKLMHHF